MNTNTVTISGRMVKQGDMRFIPSTGSAVMNGTIAVNGFKKDEVSFIDFVLFGKTAENIANMTDKGSRIVISGRLKQETWTDKQNNKRSTIKVIGNSVEIIDFAGDKKAEEHSLDDIFMPDDESSVPF